MENFQQQKTSSFRWGHSDQFDCRAHNQWSKRISIV